MIKITNVENYSVIKMLKVFLTDYELNNKHFISYSTNCFYLLSNNFKQKVQHINIKYLKGVYL